MRAERKRSWAGPSSNRAARCRAGAERLLLLIVVAEVELRIVALSGDLCRVDVRGSFQKHARAPVVATGAFVFVRWKGDESINRTTLPRKR